MWKALYELHAFCGINSCLKQDEKKILLIAIILVTLVTIHWHGIFVQREQRISLKILIKEHYVSFEITDLLIMNYYKRNKRKQTIEVFGL